MGLSEANEASLIKTQTPQRVNRSARRDKNTSEQSTIVSIGFITKVHAGRSPRHALVASN